MRLSINPETGREYPNADAIHEWRILFMQPPGMRGRPRVVKDADGPVPVPKDATEEDIFALLAQLEIDIDEDVGERTIIARAVDSKGADLFDREIDKPKTDGTPTELEPETLTEETVQKLANSLVESQKVLVTALDRMASSNERLSSALAGIRDEEEENKPHPLWEKLSRLIDDDDVDNVKDQLRAELRKQREKNAPAREPPLDVTPKKE